MILGNRKNVELEARPGRGELGLGGWGFDLGIEAPDFPLRGGHLGVG